MVDAIKITPLQATIFKAMEGIVSPEAKAQRKSLWQAIRQQHGIPADVKLTTVTDTTSPDYCVVRDKRTREPIGKAHSGMPYGALPIETVAPFFSAMDVPPVLLPIGAHPVGGGLFVHAGSLYFPLY